MNPQLTKQIGIGAVAGLVIAALTYFLLNGKRDDLKATLATIESLQKEVDKGIRYSHWGLPVGKANSMGADKDFPGYFDQDQLYDLNTDPKEQKNLASDPKHHDRLVSMQKLLREYSGRLPHTFGEFTSK